MHLKMRIMFFILICLCAMLSDAANPSASIVSRAFQIVGKCIKEHPLDTKEVERAVRNLELPSSEEGKCFLSCFLEDFGLISDGQINVDTSNEFNKMQFSDPEEVKKANDVSNACKDELSSSTDTGCDFAFAAANCVMQKAKDMGFKYFQFKT